MKVAFIGLGVMGYPMAGHLKNVGMDVCVYNRSGEKASKWCQQYGGEMAASPAAAAAWPARPRADRRRRPPAAAAAAAATAATTGAAAAADEVATGAVVDGSRRSSLVSSLTIKISAISNGLSLPPSSL